MSEQDRPTLYICTTCRRADAAPPEEGRAPEGRCLCDEVEMLVVRAGPEAPVRVVPVVCFANCERGCSVAIAAPGKWSYMVGHVGPEHAADLLTYGAAYAKSETGAVLRSGRPDSLRHAIVGRFPTHLFDQPTKDAAE